MIRKRIELFEIEKKVDKMIKMIEEDDLIDFAGYGNFRFDEQDKRNLLGSEYEKAGYVDIAIDLYEKNVKEKFKGSLPYDRLAKIYRKRRQFNDEIRVLEGAIEVFEYVVYLKHAADQARKFSQLKRYKKRLKKVQSLRDKTLQNIL
jgi:tetratricopeptide (TPR) repeat protein